MRQASKLGVGIVAILAGWALVTAVDGQQPLGSQPIPVKKGHLIIAGAKEYDLLSEAGDVEGKFRSFDPDTSLVKFRVEYEHADEKHKDEFDRQQKAYNDQLKQFQDRYKNLEKEYRQGGTGRQTQQDKNNRLNSFNSQMQTLTNDKRMADQQYRDALNKLGMVRDFIDYELLVAKDAPIRKMWAPKLFDDKGRVRSMTADERVKYKGHDSKMVGWTTKLEIFEKDTNVRVKILSAALQTEPTVAQTPPTATTPPPAPNPAVPGKDDPASKRTEVKIEDRPVVKMVIAEADPNAPTPPPAPVKQPTFRKY